MQENELNIQELNDLRNYIYEQICEQNDLEFGVFDLTEKYLVRGGVPCGMYFCLHGPRSVKLTAIWETDNNTIRFYGSTGERLHKTKLAQNVEMTQAAA